MTSPSSASFENSDDPVSDRFDCIDKPLFSCRDNDLLSSSLAHFVSLSFMNQELEAIRARVKEMEEEAEKLKQMQDEVEKQINLSPTGNVANNYYLNPYFHVLSFLLQISLSTIGAIGLTPEEKKEVDARSIYVGNVCICHKINDLEMKTGF